MKNKKIIGLIVLILLIGCETTPNNPGQLVTRAIETRYIDSNYEIAYTSAAHAFFALGFTIHHSEKGSGIIEGENVDPNIDAKRSQMALGLVPYLGVFSMFADTSDIKREVTLLLEKGPNDKRTKIRIQMVINGKPQIDPKVVDAIWIFTQREAMMTSGIDVPDDIKKKYNDLNSPQKNSSSDKNNLSD
jgi:hypothetical protein